MDDPSNTSSAAHTVPDPIVGTVIDGRYRVLHKLGEGGMGEVYAAEHVHIRKKVAIKLLREEILANEEAVARFKQEAYSASSIQHENIISIEDFGTVEDGRIYMCMEFLEGDALDALLSQGGMSAHELLEVLIQTCHGLAAAHRANIVHRDMKPENIFITHAEGKAVPKLLDFGIAKVSGNEGQNNLTRTGTIFGTPYYMSPEQALGQAVDQRVDIYSMGVIMYEAFAGSVPFEGDSFMGILTQHITTQPEAMSARAVAHNKVLPQGIEQIVVRCMAKDPAHRFQTMEELTAALIDVYRQNEGPGMSGYMQVQNARGTSQGVPVVPMGQSSSQSYRAPSHGGPASASQQQVPTQASYPHGVPAQAQGYAPSGPHPAGASASMGYQVPGQGAAYDSFSDLGVRRRKWPVVVALLAVLGTAGAVAAIVMTTDNGTINAAAIMDGAEGDGGLVQDAAVATNTSADAATVEPKDAPVIVTPPKKSTVLVNSRPPGATVFVDGKKVGRAPLNIKVPVDGTVQITLEKNRYETETFTVDANKAKQTFRLKKKPRTKPAEPDPKGTTPPKPGPTPAEKLAKFCQKNPLADRCME